MRKIVQENLYDKLKQYQETDYYPFHMPGHKRNPAFFMVEDAYGIDITEIEGFDNLHEAEGVLKETMERTAKMCHSEEAYFLVNGSTCGLLSGIAACTNHGDKILIARNCHKAVYNSIVLNELEPVYIYPQTEEEFHIHGGILPERIKEMLIKHADIKMVVLTSPTYEGIVSDVKAVADIVHAFHIPLLVDEAHGAHFGFHPSFPKSANQLGADIVIQSVHKTLPCLTQSALLHVNGTLVDRKKLRQFLSIYQSSSPSYVMMAAIDQCMSLLKRRGFDLFQSYIGMIKAFLENMKQLKHIKIYHKKTAFGVYDYDRSKIVISVKDTEMTGMELYNRLLKLYHLQMEMVSKDYVIAMTSICDTKEGFERLEKALMQIDKEIEKKETEKSENRLKVYSRYFYQAEEPKMRLTPYKALQKEGKSIPIANSCGLITKEYMYLYPPGIPLLVPGEEISPNFLCILEEYKEAGLSIKGLSDKECQYIEVVRDK